jgi:O-antigen/teichoic acid export membrane protein
MKEKDMFLKDRLLIMGSSVMVALLFGFSWVSTALAAGGVGDGDGVDGDELLWPLLVIGGGLLLIVVITYFVWQRRSRSQSQER